VINLFILQVRKW